MRFGEAPIPRRRQPSRRRHHRRIRPPRAPSPTASTIAQHPLRSSLAPANTPPCPTTGNSLSPRPAAGLATGHMRPRPPFAPRPRTPYVPISNCFAFASPRALAEPAEPTELPRLGRLGLLAACLSR
ncbi:hypothetical protein CERSUDRAFT_91244 [Gelatoporia subvermispora B]|uniref:Uncharacterized protein n=1 Tax=Ceriporiopsis subvermispora (strain B) TaxID=914234 RepID=M2PUT3_CERS8|nr:hypothetical protein CERSUDRAFT_91244 [Gelatoporia subvermispora B]